VCDRQTDGQTDILPRHSPWYAYASCGKNASRCWHGTSGHSDNITASAAHSLVFLEQRHKKTTDMTCLIAIISANSYSRTTSLQYRRLDTSKSRAAYTPAKAESTWLADLQRTHKWSPARQLQVERRTGKVRRTETNVLPLYHATN